MIEAVIFDIDGTLVDSVDLHAEAWRIAFKKFGKDVEFHAVRSQIGKGADQLLPVFLSSAELAEFGKALEEYRSNLYKSLFISIIVGMRSPAGISFLTCLASQIKKRMLGWIKSPDLSRRPRDSARRDVRE